MSLFVAGLALRGGLLTARKVGTLCGSAASATAWAAILIRATLQPRRHNQRRPPMRPRRAESPCGVKEVFAIVDRLALSHLAACLKMEAANRAIDIVGGVPRVNTE